MKDHVDIAKFDDENDADYLKLREELCRISRDPCAKEVLKQASNAEFSSIALPI
jgi:hypothetical protein